MSISFRKYILLVQLKVERRLFMPAAVYHFHVHADTQRATAKHTTSS